jgi:hypothetical protein
VIVYRPDAGPVRVEEQGELSGGEVLPGLQCRVADFFCLPEELPG